MIHMEATTMEEYGADFVTLTDDEGVTYEMEVLERFEFNGQEYIALTPAEENEDDPNLEVNILRIVEADGEEVLEAIEDEDEMEAVYDELMRLAFEEEDEED